jgi:hypothetical protein
MHDFGKLDLHHLKGVFKKNVFFNIKASRAERSFSIIEGPGCTPDPRTGRAIKVRCEDGTVDNISSYDIEILVSKDGKDIKAPITNFTGNDVPVVADGTPSEPPMRSAKAHGKGRVAYAWKEGE